MEHFIARLEAKPVQPGKTDNLPGTVNKPVALRRVPIGRTHKRGKDKTASKIVIKGG
jgi:hypothetical protein